MNRSLLHASQVQLLIHPQVGAFCAIPLAFVLPGLIFLSLGPQLGVSSVWATWFSRCSITIGIAASLFSGVTAIGSWL